MTTHNLTSTRIPKPKRQRGRPRKNDHERYDALIVLRLNEMTEGELKTLTDGMNLTKAEVLRYGLKLAYEKYRRDRKKQGQLFQ